MNILIVHGGYPLNKAAGEDVRTMNMARSLTNLENNVVVLFLYNVLNFRLRNIDFFYKKEGVTYVFIPSFPISRLLKLGLFYNRLIVWLVAKICKAQVVQAEVTWSASMTKFTKLPLVTDFHSDLVPELESMNYSASFIKKSRKDNVYALIKSSKILCVSEVLYENLSKQYNVSRSYSLLPCSVDFKFFSEYRLKRREEFREMYGLKNKIVLGYLGGTHQWQCLNETFDIFQKLLLLDDRYYFCLFTKGDLSAFDGKIDSIKGSFMTMPLEKNNLLEHLSMLDAGFVIRDNLLLNVNSSPTKIGEYMACGAMVIATKYSGDAPTLISHSGYGFVLNSINPSNEEIQDLHQNILNFCNNYSKLSPKVRDFIRYSRDWMRNEEELQKIYNELKNGKCLKLV